MHKSTSTISIIGRLVWSVIALPIGAFIEAGAASKLWEWFLSSQYGAGPSIGAWFGVLSIVDLVVLGVIRANAKQDAEDSQVVSVVRASIGRWIFMGIVLGMAFGTGSIFGWIR